jgi:hypothetical protein
LASAAEKKPDLFKNGSFLVMRKLEQDVAAFNEFAAGNADKVAKVCPVSSPPVTAATIKSLVVGRDLQSGRSLTGAADNDFSYAGEKRPGEKVPLHAHIRRSNPRTTGSSPIPRILRRGFSYGRPYSAGDQTSDRGLLFMAYNANIGRQFEVVQRWLNGGNSTGRSSAENDVVTGVPQLPGVKRWVNVDGSLVALDGPAKNLVTLRWGFYLFAPSKNALELLAGGRPAARTSAPGADDLEAGRQILADLRKLGPEKQRAAWQEILEGRQSKLQARQLWEAIRVDENGVLDAGEYGLLVGTVEAATAVLGDDGKKFSVREYWQRLGESIGEHYLGFDRLPGAMPAAGDRDVRFEAKSALVTYAQLSADPNAYIASIAAGSGYRSALNVARQTLKELKQIPGPMDLEVFALATVGRLAHEWVGTPLPVNCSAPDMARFMENFALVSVSTFQTYPDASLRALARKSGQTLRLAYAAARGRMDGMASKLTEKNQELVELAMIGAIVGFAAPAVECIVSTLVQLMNAGGLASLAEELGSVPTDDRKWQLLAVLTDILLDAPVPSILYRTALDNAVVGARTAAPGSCVVVGLQSVCADAANKSSEPLQWMFGGTHGGISGTGYAPFPNPPHGCPARNLVLQALAGVLAAVVELEGIKRDGAASISFELPETYQD